MVLALVKGCGGTADVDSELGRGTRIRLSFPSAADALLSQTAQAPHSSPVG